MSLTVAHIGPSKLPILYPMGGATERRIREIATRQATRGDKVIIYSAEAQTRTSEYNGAEIRALRCMTSGVLRCGEFMVKAVRDMKSLRPDVIHFHSHAEGAALARGIDAVKVLSYDFYMFRRGKQNPFHPWYRKALNRFSRLLPVSDYCLRESASYWSLPADRMRVVYNGVSLQQFYPDPAAGAAYRKAIGIEPDEFVALYVGRVCYQKGTDLLIEACRQLREEGRKLRLVVAGPVGQFGSEGGGELTKRLQETGGIYLGPVEESQLRAVYNLCDVFVMPTLAYEMFGMAAIEAQACGKAVICSNNGGLPEVIPADSGMLFQMGEVAGLTANLRSLMDSRKLHQRLTSAAVPNARRFAWETIATDLEEVYSAR